MLRAIPLLPCALRFFAAALGSFHYAVYIALWSLLATWSPELLCLGDSVPMACLYSPYSFSRVADGGFCDPVRILLTVLSAWLNTLSVRERRQHVSPDPSAVMGTRTHRVGHGDAEELVARPRCSSDSLHPKASGEQVAVSIDSLQCV